MKDHTEDLLMSVATGRLARVEGRSFRPDVEQPLALVPRSDGNEPTAKPAWEGVRLPEGMPRELFERALQAARDLFVGYGPGYITPKSIAVWARLKPEAAEQLKHFIPEGEVLTVELVRSFSGPFVEVLSEAATDPKHDMLTTIEKLGRRWLAHARRDLPMLLALVRVLRDEARDTPVRAEALKIMDFQQKVFVGLLAEGQIQGKVRSGNLEVMVMSVGAVIYGLLLTLSEPRQLLLGGVYAEEVTEETLQLVLRGLRP